MISTDLNYRVKELSETINMMRLEISDLKNKIFEKDMWDNSDMIRNWNISLRTLATWRSEGLIDYVQLGSKIGYTKENRNDFMKRNTVNGAKRVV